MHVEYNRSEFRSKSDKYQDLMDDYDRLKESYRKSLKTEDDVIDFIDTNRNQFNSLPAEDVSFPRSVKGLAKYSDPASIYRKSTPLHVKGSLIYNMMLKKNKLT